MTRTLIIACSRCAGLLLAKTDQKTRTCPYCGLQVNVERAKKISSAETSYKASEILRELKSHT